MRIYLLAMNQNVIKIQKNVFVGISIPIISSILPLPLFYSSFIYKGDLQSSLLWSQKHTKKQSSIECNLLQTIIRN